MLTKDQITEKVLDQIRSGAVFICPTDTIYGLSCDARNESSVRRIRELKQRPAAPLSIWAPSKEWVKQNCQISNELLNKLPGPYTLIVGLKKEDVIAKNVANNNIGIRIPGHWFSDIVNKLGFPIITTSVNKQGENHMVSIETGDKEIVNKVDFVIYEGEKTGRPSTILQEKEKKIMAKQR